MQRLAQPLPEGAMPFRDRIAALSSAFLAFLAFLDSERVLRVTASLRACVRRKGKGDHVARCYSIASPAMAGTRAGTRCEGLRRRAFARDTACAGRRTSSRP